MKMGSLAVSANRDSIDNLKLRETVVVGTMAAVTNSIYECQRQLFARSERVKGIDFHPVEPWILTTLYSGTFWMAHAHQLLG